MEEWSVLLKVARDPDAPGISRSDVEAIIAALSGSDDGATGGDGPDATFSCWVEASDAAAAISTAWRLIEEQRQRLGLEPWRPIRSHSASAAQRLTGFDGVQARVADDSAWSVLMKATLAAGGEPATDEVRSDLRERLGPDASVAGNADTLVARYWVAAPDAVSADVRARAVLEEALAHKASSGRWTIIRAHHAVASERAEEIYRGAAARVERASQGGDR